MNHITIKIPARSTDNFGDPISFFMDCVEAINSDKNAPVFFDFSVCQFVNPFVLGGIASLVQFLENSERKVTFSDSDISPSLDQYSNDQIS